MRVVQGQVGESWWREQRRQERKCLESCAAAPTPALPVRQLVPIVPALFEPCPCPSNNN